jgi:hypothetical protein
MGNCCESDNDKVGMVEVIKLKISFKTFIVLFYTINIIKTILYIII